MKILSSEDFSLIKLNRPADWNNLSVMAKKHAPIIEAPDTVKADQPFPVKIKIGGIDGVEHPNTLSHWINWVALYSGERLIAKVQFGSELSDGYGVTINVILKDSGNLKAKGFCNLHGVWEGKTKLVKVQ